MHSTNISLIDDIRSEIENIRSAYFWEGKWIIETLFSIPYYEKYYPRIKLTGNEEVEVYNEQEGLKIYTKENQHRNYQQEILSSMISSEIMEMIIDKRKEIKTFPKDIEWYKIDMELTKKDMELMINRLNFEIRQRDPDTKTENTKEFLDQKKREISIVNVIQSITGKHIDQSLSRNIKCFLPGHNDKTGSLHIYNHTNTFKCFGCQRGGSQVDLIKEYNQISIGQAIKLFLQM